MWNLVVQQQAVKKVMGKMERVVMKTKKKRKKKAGTMMREKMVAAASVGLIGNAASLRLRIRWIIG